MTDDSDTLLEFPCDFPIKVFGLFDDGFRDLVVELITPYLDGSEIRLSENISRKGRYLSITATVVATSKSQLDDIYRALSAHESIIMVL